MFEWFFIYIRKIWRWNGFFRGEYDFVWFVFFYGSFYDFFYDIWWRVFIFFVGRYVVCFGMEGFKKVININFFGKVVLKNIVIIYEVYD